MAQNSKYIDVTRTYVPVDPNAFPLNLQTSGQADAPEQHIPVMAYKGYNFLPTSYGYKSFFGVEQKLAIEALTARVDSIFIYQSLAYQNILVALTDSGIWVKRGTESGAWENIIAMTSAYLDPDTHFEWSYCIIQNVLYAYRQGQPSYQKFVSSPALGVVITSVVPNFLNMSAQVGIFRASGRLAFWDSDDSISWSNLDNPADFTPSLETLAGAIKFSEMHGRIVTVKQHGSGFIIYATKSILYIAQDAANLYQWAPRTILPNAGIQYPRQVAVGSPDTIHFAFTSEGLKKIINAQEETIIPEVTDYLREYQRPVYLSILQGRYLFIELVDDDYLTGHVQFEDVVVPGATYTFPGGSYGELEDYYPGGGRGGVCVLMPAFDSGAMINAGQPDVPPDGVPLPLPDDPDQDPDPKPDAPVLPLDPADPGNVPKPYKEPPYTYLEPVYTGHFSNKGKMNSNFIWKALPCTTLDAYGEDAKMCPDIPPMAERANLTPLTGADLYNDGKLTIERFSQVQMAMWKMEENSIKDQIEKISNRSSVTSVTTHIDYPGTCTSVETIIPERCVIGRFPIKFATAPLYGFSKCQFWLTRWMTEFADIVRIRAWTAVCKEVDETYSLWRVEQHDVGSIGTTDYMYGSPEECAAVASASYASVYPLPNFRGTYKVGGLQGSSPAGAPLVYQIDAAPEFGGGKVCRATRTVTRGRGYERTVQVTAYNKVVPVDAAPVADTAVLTISGWRYKKLDGTYAIIPSTACTQPMTIPGRGPGGEEPPSDPRLPKEVSPLPVFDGDDPEPLTGPGGGPNNVPISSNTYMPTGPRGSLCSGAFEPPLPIPGNPPIVWPSTSVTIPDGSFLLQTGSIAPIYPNFAGALVYDLHLKKWGKMRLPYKQLLDYSPINTTDSGVVLYSAFGILGGILDAGGKISLFDAFPKDSYISYGKVGYYRLGKTSPEEVTVHFRTPCTGTLKVETSLRDNKLATGWSKTQPYTDATSVTLYGAYPGSWCNIEVRGQYDINYLEYRGVIQGRR